MKNVFTNQELPHVWIKESQETGRANSMFFRNSIIYSYDEHFPIAKIYHHPKRGKYVLFTSKDYSSTTGNHKSLVKRAIDCPWSMAYNVNLGDTKFGDVQKHHDNLTQALDNIEKTLAKAGRARLAGGFFLSEAVESIDGYTGYIEFFKPSLLSRHKKAYASMISQTFIDPMLRAKIDANIIKEKQAQELRDKIAIEKEQENLLLWRNGSNLNCHFLTCALRIKGNNVETSHGAKVPIDEARILAGMIKNGKDVLGFNINGFKIVSYIEGILKIGCHNIPQSEIDAILPFLV